MEAILFIQKKRGLQEPEVEPVGMKSYLLIRVALNVAEENWFGENLREPVPINWENKRFETPEHLRLKPWHPFGAYKQKREYFSCLQKEAECRYELQRASIIEQEMWQKKVEEAGEKICKLKSEVMMLAGDCTEIYAVYEDAVRNALMKGTLAHIWQQNFPLQEFNGYGKEFWNIHLLPEPVPNHFVVLGSCRDIFSLLEYCAPRMRSLQWFLLKEDCNEHLLEMGDVFCEEYGLVIEQHTLEGWRELQKAGLVCPEKTCILDFTGELYLSAAKVKKGSVWLDMYASEQKKQKMERRDLHITYFSLKGKWKMAQKRCNCAVFP